ncbi:MAG: TonB-dependent receptor [Sphingomonadales bacterium]|nr:TonB-dependent receptor [Sphingomonadales bacterium]
MSFTNTSLRNLRRGVAHAGIAATLLAAAPALAAPAAEPQANSGQLDEIVVTAQHREENLRAVPIAVTAVTADTLKNAGVSNTTELVQAVPTVNFTRSGPSGIFVIRGVATPNGSVGEEGSTAVYVDDVYMPDLSSTINKFNNIQRIEVLNGPQGTLFGRNATGGLIRIITRDPGDKVVFNGQMGYGNYQTFDGQLYASTPLGEKAGIDIAFTGHDQGKGFGYDATLGKDVRQDKYWGVRSKLVLRPSDRIKLTVTGDYYKTDDTTSIYIFPINFSAVTGLSTGPISSQDSPAGFPGGTHIKSWGVSGKAEIDLDFADLTAVSAYRKTLNTSAFDVDGQAPDLFHLTYDSGSRSFQQELRLSSKTSDPLSWQIGAFYLHATAFTDQYQAGAALRGAVLHIVSRGVTDSISGFGELTYALTPSTHLTGGIRYTSDKRKLPVGYIDTTLGLGGTLLSHATSSVTEKTYGETTFRVALRQDLTDTVNVYASVNRGFKSGEFNLQTPTNANPPVDPETIMAYEAGLKGDFLDRRLRVSLAGYHYNIDNYQIRSSPNGTSVLANAAKVKIDGFDMNAEAAVTSQFHVTLGAAWLNARYSSFPAATPTAFMPANPATPGKADATGKQTALAPHFTLNLGATYTLPLGEARELRLSANMTHKSSYVFEPDNLLRQPAYTVASASIEYKLNEHISIEGYMRNIGNKNYNVQMVTAVGQAALAAEPRTYGLNFKWDY